MRGGGRPGGSLGRVGNIALEDVAGEQPNGACELQAAGEVVRSLKFYSSNMGAGPVRFGWKGDVGHLVVRWDL